MDYTSTNNWYGWMHYYLAYLLKCCGLDGAEALINAEMCMYKSCIRALLYKSEMMSGYNLSDNECILSSHTDWIPEILNAGVDTDALNWWLSNI